VLSSSLILSTTVEFSYSIYNCRAFTDAQRLSKLLALMSLAMCWAMKIGQWLHSHSPLKIKKHGRLTKSIFRYGLDHLRSIVTDLDLKSEDFLRCLQFLSCT
jgi:hypothetical protein